MTSNNPPSELAQDTERWLHSICGYGTPDATGVLPSRFLNAALNALHEHIAIIDENGVIRFVNSAWKSFAENNGGPDMTCGLGANYLEACEAAAEEGDENAAQVMSSIDDLFNHKLERAVVSYPCHSPSEQRWYQVRISRFNTVGPTHAVLAHENITDVKLLQERERSIRLEMEDVLSCVVHDLRHPIVSIQGILGMAREDDLEVPREKVESMYDIAVDECERMNSMISQIADLARIGRTKPHVQETNLRAIVETVIARCKPLIDEKRARIRIGCSDETIPVCAEQIIETLTNVVDNALKYGCPEPGMTIHIDGGNWRAMGWLDVTDDGPGIPSELHERVFQIFRRIDPAGDIEGSGVGLAAARRLMRQIGGEINLTSEEGQGSRFRVKFPIGPNALSLENVVTK